MRQAVRAFFRRFHKESPTAAEFHRLADAPPEVQWFASISNRHTRRAYEKAVKDSMRFAGIGRPEEFRTVTRAHIIAWRDDLVRRDPDRFQPSDPAIGAEPERCRS